MCQKINACLIIILFCFFTHASIAQTSDCVITSQATEICAGETTSLCAPYGYGKYIWSTGETTMCITVSVAGTYSVTVSEPNGRNVIITSGDVVTTSLTCSKTIYSKLSPQSSITTSNTDICEGKTASLCTQSGNNASYLWSNGETVNCIDVSESGTYALTVTGANGCTSSSSVSITVRSAPLSTISGTSGIFCEGKKANLCATSGMSSYSWNSGETTSCIETEVPGYYTVTVTNNQGCTSTSSKTITKVPLPVCAITGENFICQGGTTELCAPEGMSYVWSNGSTSRCITVTYPGTYSVTITDSNGCTSSCSRTIVQYPVPPCSISGNSSFCLGSTMQLCATPGMSSYLWNTGATTSCIVISSPGTYTVTVTNSKGCQSTCSKNVTANPQPVCTITGDDAFCQGGSQQLCASPGMSTYLWSNGATTQCITITSGGIYSVIGTNSIGCRNTCTKTVTSNPILPLNITGNNSVCYNSTTPICAPGGFTSYLWSNGSTTQCINVSGGTFSVTMTNSTGCTSTSSKNIAVLAPENFSIIGENTICAGGTNSLCAPPGFLSYSWSTGETTQCITINSTGTYTVHAKNVAGCITSVSKTILSGAAQTCTITNSGAICEGGTVELCATPGFTSYVWSTGNTSVSPCLNVSNAGNYTVTATNSSGCKSTGSTTVLTSNASTISISGENIICQGSATELCAPAGYNSYLWSNGATTKCINVSAAGQYSLQVTDAGGCVYNASMSITTSQPVACNLSSTGILCQGGSAQICASPGYASYKWNTGEESEIPCLTVTSAGTYSVTITNSDGCESTCSKTIVSGQATPGSITGNNSICEGTSSPICAPAGFVSYSWDNGATTQCISANATATYSVIMTDAAGCVYTVNKDVSSNSCGVSLTITTDVCEVLLGTPTPVTFTYTVKNSGSQFQASGTLTDDNGTYANTTDDILIGNWGPLASGEQKIFTRTYTISNDYTNVAVASGISGGAPVNAIASTTITSVNCTCDPTYPDNSNLPRSAVVFNESEILRASDPGIKSCGTTGSEIKLWYNDEHALTLGVNKVIVKTASGISTTNYSITPSPSPYGCVNNPLVGTTISTGDQSGNDLAEGGGRPLWPALFITDLTLHGLESRAGDWQQGGTGIPPSRVCGTWKGATRTIDKTKNPPKITITPNVNPPKNNWNLGAGSHVPPGGFAALENEGYGAEIVWNINELGLTPGHTYRLQFMIHDGDQNKNGGDVGESYAIFHVPGNNCSSTATLGNLVWNDENRNGIKDLQESGIEEVDVKLYTDQDRNNVADGSAIASTKTGSEGNYTFKNLAPGNYIVGVTLKNEDSLTAVNVTDPNNNIDNDNNGVTIIGTEARSNSISLAIGTEPINDGDGNNGNLTLDFGIARPVPISEQKCYRGSIHNFVIATQKWTVNSSEQTVTIRTEFSKNFADNTYGNNAIGWMNGHTFSDLSGSDKLQMALYDINNIKRLEFRMDYISSSNEIPSGYKSKGVSGGDGKMLLGSATNILRYKTSLDQNINDYGYHLFSNSPATNTTYAGNANYPKWIYEVWYEVTVELSAFPGGFGEPVITSIHASPSKTGINSEPMNEHLCATARIEAPIAPITRNINAYLYPNPARSIANFTFQRTGHKARTILELYTVTGSLVSTLFDEEIEPDVLYKVQANIESLTQGTYIYKVISEDKILTGKLLVVTD